MPESERRQSGYGDEALEWHKQFWSLRRGFAVLPYCNWPTCRCNLSNCERVAVTNL